MDPRIVFLASNIPRTAPALTPLSQRGDDPPTGSEGWTEGFMYPNGWTRDSYRKTALVEPFPGFEATRGSRAARRWGVAALLALFAAHAALSLWYSTP